MRKYIVGIIMGVLLLCPSLAQAQYGYYGYPGYGYGYSYSSTIAEGYGHGLADVIRSQGIYNQLSADALARIEDARQHYIENYKLRMETQLQLQDEIKSRRAREHAEDRYKTLQWLEHRRPVQISRLSETQLDAATGQIHWPAVLMDKAFASQRAELELLFAKRARQGNLYSIDDRLAVKTAADDLQRKLEEVVDKIDVRDVILAKHFIEGLANEPFYIP